eukprot:XP_022279994.1 cysteine-rich DPF motif domain-containing protein 1 isoform X1 [Canis lupus familiaris]
MPCVLGLQMEGEAGRRPLGVFKCQLCALTAPYSYVGQKPPDTHSVVLLEESYVMKDPFTPDKDRFLVLGSRCSLCSRLVCVSPVGMQFILLQEILPPLCPGQHGRLPSGNPARLGEKESSIEEACQPAWLSDSHHSDLAARSSEAERTQRMGLLRSCGLWTAACIHCPGHRHRCLLSPPRGSSYPAAQKPPLAR